MKPPPVWHWPGMTGRLHGNPREPSFVLQSGDTLEIQPNGSMRKLPRPGPLRRLWRRFALWTLRLEDAPGYTSAPRDRYSPSELRHVESQRAANRRNHDQY